MGEALSPWSDAVLAAALVAVDPKGLCGVHVRARAGLVRERWLRQVADFLGADVPMRRVAAGISEDRLSGGLDLSATLASGRPMVQRGVLAAADRGVLVLAMAERLSSSAAALIGAALDEKEVRIERDGLSGRHPAGFALIALDEGVEEERLAPALADRLALRVDLDAIGWRETEGERGDPPDIERARALLPAVSIAPEWTEALCAIAMTFAAASIRPSIHLLRAARAVAALRGSARVEGEDAAAAMRLVLGLQPAPANEERASAAENEAEQEDGNEAKEPEQRPGDEAGRAQAPGTTDPPSAKALEEMLVAAVAAVLPKHLLAGATEGSLHRSSRHTVGKAGPMQMRGTRGRGIGTLNRPPTPGARLDVLATLRQAAPWQRIRAGEADPLRNRNPPRLRIRAADFRYVRYRDKTGTTAIFAVDASGSAAVERLAESKGAVELLLAECYVRRDSVALIAFRGRKAETLLEPTRSLVRAKRSLAALPGGGGTPLAGGILATLALAEASLRKGQGVVAVFLTDGRGNVAIDGTSERTLVAEDLAQAARRFKACGLRSILIDTAQRPQARARDLARDLGAEYLALPRAGARAMAREIGARMGE